MPRKQEHQEHDNLVEQFDQLYQQLSAIKAQTSSLQQHINQVEKMVQKQVKGLKKEVASKTKPKTTRAPSGFAKPCKVSNELCAFMHKEAGSEIARTEATRALVSYIKEHKLENASNSKKIVPDATLKQLLGIGDGDEVELNYFNIQQHMNKHFIKTP